MLIKVLATPLLKEGRKHCGAPSSPGAEAPLGLVWDGPDTGATPSEAGSPQQGRAVSSGGPVWDLSMEAALDMSSTSQGLLLSEY